MAVRKTHIDRAISRNSLPKEWDHALCALQGHERAGLGFITTGRYNAAPLAFLLQSGAEVPAEVARTIGRLLSPSKKYIGGRLKFHPPNKRARNLLDKKLKEQRAYQEFRRLVDGGTLQKIALKTIAKKYNMSESAVEKLKNISYEDLFSELSERLSDVNYLP